MRYTGIHSIRGLHHVENGGTEYLVWRADHLDMNRGWPVMDGYVVIRKNPNFPREDFWINVEDQETRRQVVLCAWPMVDEFLPEFPK